MRKTHTRGVLSALIIIAALTTMSGCLGDYGRLKGNPALTDAFKNRQTLPDYNYYYTGRENLPYAVVGIDPRYQFKDRVWHPIESKEEVYKQAAGITAWDRHWARGADILDADGNRIGIWFSYYDSTTIKVGPENLVAVYSPYSPNRNHKGKLYGGP